MREKQGSVFQRRGSWWARVTYLDEAHRDANGKPKRREKVRKAKTERAATKLCETLLQELERGDVIETFDQLADYYESEYVHAPVNVHGRREGGMRALSTVRSMVKVIREAFRGRKLRRIHYPDLRSFRIKRLTTPTKGGGQRAIASVNRELVVLRRMLNIAVQHRAIDRNPFADGEELISAAGEVQRERILTREEEARLLAACDVPQRRHIRAVVIGALDTGARRGELLTLKWRNVDLGKRSITFESWNTKTQRERSVHMTARLLAEVKRLAKESGAHPDALVFGVEGNIRKAWVAARKAAGLPGLRIHDLRHTAATRLVRGNLALPEVGRVLGHTQAKTTYRYINADHDTAAHAARIFDDFNETPAEKPAAAVEAVN